MLVKHRQRVLRDLQISRVLALASSLSTMFFNMLQRSHLVNGESRPTLDLPSIIAPRAADILWTRNLQVVEYQ